jgi:hypothetical protein
MGLRKADKTVSIPPPAPPPAKKSEAPKKKAPAPKKSPRVSSGPVEPLASRTFAVLHRAHRERPVHVASARAEPLIETRSDEVALAGRSELLALAAGTAVHRERSAVLLAAHVVTTDGESGVMAALARLLE